MRTRAVGAPLERVVVGPGYVDASVRQVVRTSGDRVYVFAADDTAQKLGTGPGVIRAYRADRSGVPASFAEVDGAHRPTSSGTDVLGSPDARLDLNGVVHLVYVNKADHTLVYRTFFPATDTWGPPVTLATGVSVGTHSFRRAETANTLVLDRAEAPHVVYTAGNSVLYRNRVAGSWSAPEVIATTTAPIHPQLAADGDGNLHVSWLDQSSPPRIRYAKRNAGAWGPAEVVADGDVLSNANLDQGPSIVVTQSGVPVVLYVSALPASAVRVKYRSTTGWALDAIPSDLYTHTPQIYSAGDDLYAFLGHDAGINFGYLYQLAGQAWSPYRKLTSEQDDGAASVRWDPFRDYNPEVIDTTFYDENVTGTGFLAEAYYMAVPAQSAPVPVHTPGVVVCDVASIGARAATMFARAGVVPPDWQFVSFRPHFYRWNGASWVLAHTGPWSLSFASGALPTQYWWDLATGAFRGTTADLVESVAAAPAAYWAFSYEFFWWSSGSAAQAYDHALATTTTGPKASGTWWCSYP